MTLNEIVYSNTAKGKWGRIGCGNILFVLGNNTWHCHSISDLHDHAFHYSLCTEFICSVKSRIGLINLIKFVFHQFVFGFS